MLKKQHRLSTKDVNYILKRRQTISTADFLFFHIAQYPNRSYNQFAIQLSTKLHKRSNRRNKLKRIYYDIIEKNNYLETTTDNKWFIKTIALPHKTKVEEWNKLLEQNDWQQVSNKLQISLQKLFVKKE